MVAESTTSEPQWLELPDDPTYTPYRSVEAAGAWIGLLTCEACGAAILLDTNEDEDFDPVKQHTRWHRSLETMHGWANTKDGQKQVTVRRRSS